MLEGFARRRNISQLNRDCATDSRKLERRIRECEIPARDLNCTAKALKGSQGRCQIGRDPDVRRPPFIREFKVIDCAFDFTKIEAHHTQQSVDGDRIAARGERSLS